MEILNQIKDVIIDAFNKIKEFIKRIINKIKIIAKRQLFKLISPIKGRHIAHLAIYHKNYLVRKKNLKRIIRFLN